MSRARAASQAGPSWLWVPAGLVLYGVGLVGLRVLGGGDMVAWPIWTGVIAPVVIYALLALARLGGRAPARLLAATASSIAGHAALVGMAPLLATLLPVPARAGAAGAVAWDSLALSGLVVVCVALLTVPLASLLRPRPRTVRSAVGGRPGPRAQGQPTARPAAEPVRVLPRRAEPAPGILHGPATLPTAQVPAASPSPVIVPASPPEPPVKPEPLVGVSADAGVPAGALEGLPDTDGTHRRGEPARVPEPLEEVVRISFDRIADQLPQDLFLLPRERVAANLLEPGALLVPRRLVLPQLVEGAVKVPWSAVVDQFPSQALAVTDSEVAERLQDGVIDLPLDEVLGQLASDLFALASPVADVSDLENFPPPFQPYVPPARSDTEAVVAPEPIEEPAVAEPVEEPAIPAGPMSETPERLAARFAPVIGPLVITTRAVGGVPVQVFRAPGLDEEAVFDTASRILPLIWDAPLSVPLRQATLWGSEVALVVTPLAPGAPGGSAVVTATPRGASVGLLERFALHASTEVASSRPGVDLDPAAPASAGSLLEVTCPPEVRTIAGHLGGPGAVAPLVLREQDGRLVYAFLSRGMPARALASLAARLHRLLDGSAIPLDTVALRIAACRVLSRQVRGPDGTGALVVLGSVSVDRPGLARLEMDRIAARLAAVVGG